MSIHKFLKTYQEWVLGAVALALGLMVAGVFFWGITDLALNLGKAVTPRQSENIGTRFDLEGAKRLDLKGLAQ